MDGITLTFPILAAKVEAWRRFCQALAGTQRQAYETSRLRLGITRERMTLVESAFGAAATIILEADDMSRALGQFITSNDPFDYWYRKQLEDMHGINLTQYEEFSLQAPPSDKQELLFEWVLRSYGDN